MISPLAYSHQYQTGLNQGGNGYLTSYHPNISPYHSQSFMSQQAPMVSSNPYFYGEGLGANPFMYNGTPSNHGNPAEWILDNPLQPKKNNGGGNPYGANQTPYLHPYPKHGMVKRPPAGISSIMNSFKTQDGQFDLNKMIDTAGQMMNAVNQVSGLVKGLGGIFKV